MPQLAPTGKVKLPEIHLPSSQRLILYGAGAILFVAVVVFILGRVRNQTAETPPNAVFIGENWTYTTREDAEVAQLAENLRTRAIGTVYAWFSWLEADNTWNNDDRFAQVRQFTAQFNAAYPEAELLAWIVVPVNAGQGYRLNQADVQSQVAQFSQLAVGDYGFDGVFINADPLSIDDQNFLALLRRVRLSIGDTAVLAAAIPPDWRPGDTTVPASTEIAPATEWSVEYKQSVALLLDEIVIMAFNSRITSAADYSQWMAHQVSSYARAIAGLGEDIQTRVLIGIPTHDADGQGHNPQVENVASAAEGIRAGTASAGVAAGYVQGVAIYAEWTADDDEWTQFSRLWLGR
jgi:hypothetical protein